MKSSLVTKKIHELPGTETENVLHLNLDKDIETILFHYAKQHKNGIRIGFYFNKRFFVKKDSLKSGYHQITDTK